MRRRRATVRRVPRRWKGLEVFPLLAPDGHPPTCELIDELLDRHDVDAGRGQRVEPSEVSGGPSPRTALQTATTTTTSSR